MSEKSEQISKSLLEALEDHCKEKNQDFEKTLIWLMESLGWSENKYGNKRGKRVADDLKKRRYRSDKEYYDGTNRHYRALAIALMTLLEMDPKHLELPVEDLAIDFINEKRKGKIKVIPLRNFSGNETTRNDMGEKYKMENMGFLDKIDHRFHCYDYLNRFHKEDKDEKISYTLAHKNIFEKLQDILKGSSIEDVPSIEYCRIMALPMGSYKVLGRPKESTLTEHILYECSFPLFEHIYNCLSTYSIYNEPNSKGDRKEGFFMLGFTPRAYSYGYIDEGKICLTEHYRYDHNGICKLDAIFVEEGIGDIRHLYDMYKTAVNKAFSHDAAIRLTRPMFENAYRDKVNDHKAKLGRGIKPQIDNPEMQKIDFLSDRMN